MDTENPTAEATPKTTISVEYHAVQAENGLRPQDQPKEAEITTVLAAVNPQSAAEAKRMISFDDATQYTNADPDKVRARLQAPIDAVNDEKQLIAEHKGTDSKLVVAQDIALHAALSTDANLSAGHRQMESDITLALTAAFPEGAKLATQIVQEKHIAGDDKAAVQVIQTDMAKAQEILRTHFSDPLDHDGNSLASSKGTSLPSQDKGQEQHGMGGKS